jgi:hypothetical protein
MFQWAVDPVRLQKKALASGKKIRLTRVAVGQLLGTESRMFRGSLRQDGIDLAFYAVLWRSGPVAASVIVLGVASATTPSDALKFASRLDRRLAALE